MFFLERVYEISDKEIFRVVEPVEPANQSAVEESFFFGDVPTPITWAGAAMK